MTEFKKFYPNQKVIITKKTCSDEQHVYSRDNVDAVLAAARILPDRAFKLYVSMNLHQDGYTYGLSPVDIHGRIGFSEKKYRQAVDELIENGYLVENAEGENVFTFYEAPHIDSAAQNMCESSLPQMDGVSLPNGQGIPPKWTGYPSQTGSSTPPKWAGHLPQTGSSTPPKWGREIIQDNTMYITSNNINDTTRNITEDNTDSTVHYIEDFGDILEDGEVPF